MNAQRSPADPAKNGYLRRSELCQLALLLFAAPALAAGGTVTLPLTPGWDDFPQLQSGSLVRTLTGRSLTLSFTLTGGLPSTTYHVGFDIFNQPNPGVSAFGTPRTVRGTFTREGNTATVDVFILADVTSDASGNATLVSSLDLSGVAAGAYLLQYTFQIVAGGHVAYRTGTAFGVGFDEIDLAPPVPMMSEWGLLMVGTLLAGISVFLITRRNGADLSVFV